MIADQPIVMVDDNQIDTRLIERSLASSALKNQLVAFSSGQNFMEYVAEVESGTAAIPALILLDINMPKMNGFEILDALRRKKLFENVRIIMLTHSDNPKDIERAHALNAGYAEKFSERRAAVAFLESLL